MISVLDHGYVQYLDHMGSDLSVVNAARASFNKESEEWTDSDKRLLDFLAREGHTSPFRHATLSLELKAPLLVCRQLWKYAVSSRQVEDQAGWNEASRRYITMGMDWYNPTQWRLAPDNRKQGSAGNAAADVSVAHNLKLAKHITQSVELFYSALEDGIAPEMARLYLPAYSLYVTWRWTMSLHTALHVIDERTAPDAQCETREYGKAIGKVVEGLFPHSLEAWTNADHS